MKKKVNLRLLIMATGLVLMTAAFFAACGDPGTGATPTFTVKYMDGNKELKPPETVTKGGNGTKADPDYDPTVPPSKEEGLYKNFAAAPAFLGWSEEAYATEGKQLSQIPITKDTTLYAVWDRSGLEKETLDTGNIVEKAFTFINSKNPATDDPGWTLVLTRTDPYTVSNALTPLSKNYSKLTITTDSTAQRTIKSGLASGVFLSIGPTGTSVAANSTGIVLTLRGIIIEGKAGLKVVEGSYDPVVDPEGDEVTESLVRVAYGATLIMENQARITGHRSDVTTANGANGNGSAVCVYGGTLTMKEGSSIDQNESTKDNASPNTTNRNRVGGVYTYSPTLSSNKVPVTLNIEGGKIVNNKCTSGNTKDVYATEGGTFKLSGNVKINEITLNADQENANASIPTNTSSNPNVYTTIEVSNLTETAEVNISLRASITIESVKTIWTWGTAAGMTGSGIQVLKGPNDSAPSSNDVAKFTFVGFKGLDGFKPYAPNDAAEFKLDATGKFVKITP